MLGCAVLEKARSSSGQAGQENSTSTQSHSAPHSKGTAPLRSALPPQGTEPGAEQQDGHVMGQSGKFL